METGLAGSASSRRSRLVTTPSSRPSVPTTGKPEMRYRRISSWERDTGSSGPRVTGPEMKPDSERLTRSTIEACSSTVQFLWMTPMPPWRATATAISPSVTLSMAADSRGTRRFTPSASSTATSTSRGRTEEGPGRSSTSS